jgi:trk system potassium uptake protein TrkA
LGEISLILFKSKTKEKYNESFRKTIDQISDIKQFIDEKSAVYKDLRKRYSSNYEIKKLTDDLGHGDVVISQSIISENSNMADKLLKDTLLPKEALISVVKRGEEVIIPDGNTKLYPGDNVTVIGRPEDVEKIARRISSRE